MLEKSSPFQINYPKIHPKIEVPPPNPLPFSLRNPSVSRAMLMLGMKEDDLAMKPIQHFLKTEKNDQRAIESYNRTLNQRNEMIKQIQQIANEIDGIEAIKLDSDVIYERHMEQVDRNLLKSKEELNKQTIRAIALNQLRYAYKVQHGEEKVQKQIQISSAYDEKYSQKLETAMETVNTREFQPRGPGNVDCLLFNNKTGRVFDEDEFAKKYTLYINERQRKLQENSKANNEKINEVQNRKVQQYSSKIDKLQQRLDRNEEILAKISTKNQEKDQISSEKAEKRSEKLKNISNKGDELLQSKIEKTTNLMKEKEIKFQNVMKANQAKTNEMIAREADILKRRNEAAEKIFEKQKKDIESFRDTLSKREEKLEQRKNELHKQTQDRLYNARIELEEKTASIRRSQRARDFATAIRLQKRVARSVNGLDGIQRQRMQNQMAKIKAGETFSEQRSNAMGLFPKVVNLNDAQKVSTLVNLLGISENEANDLVDRAKMPASMH